MYTKLFILLMCSISVFCDSLILNPCSHRDIECLSKATETFLEKTSLGIPKADIKPIDPLSIPSLAVEDEKIKIVLHFTNITVTGLKTQQISDFIMNTTAKSVVLKTKAHLKAAVAHATVELEDENDRKSLPIGPYTISSTVIGTFQYPYTIRKTEAGLEHYDVGQETISCESIDDPEIIVDQNSYIAARDDPASASRHSDYEANKITLRKKVICEIAKVAYVNVVHNIRAAAKILPKSAFFTDV